MHASPHQTCMHASTYVSAPVPRLVSVPPQILCMIACLHVQIRAMYMYMDTLTLMHLHAGKTSCSWARPVDASATSATGSRIEHKVDHQQHRYRHLGSASASHKLWLADDEDALAACLGCASSWHHSVYNTTMHGNTSNCIASRHHTTHVPRMCQCLHVHLPACRWCMAWPACCAWLTPVQLCL